MDFLSDNFAFAVFIVIAVVLQIVRLFVRKAQRRGREERPQTAAYREEPAEERPRTGVYREAAHNGYGEYGEDEEEGDGEFSAWNLSVDDEAESPAPVSPPAAPRPVSFSAPFSAPASGLFSAPLPEASPFPALSAASVPVTENREPEKPFSPIPESGPPIDGGDQYRGRGKGRPGRSAGFPANLDYLSPLKRAVVLAEILGAPKGV
jgi:hypothetical protein